MRVLICCLFSLPLIVSCLDEVDNHDTIVEPSEREFAKASRDPIDVNMSPAFSKNEMYRDMLHITNKNFTEIVLKSKEPWVIVFHDGNIFKPWKTMAMSMRGLIWIGIVNKLTEKQILDKLNLEPEKLPPALVLPYNYYWRSRLEKAVHVQTPLEARKKAVASIPDRTLHLGRDAIQDFLIEAYMARPSRFPLLFLTYDQEPSALLKALAYRFSKYFHFGVMSDPSPEDMEALGMGKSFLDLPSLFVLITGSSGQNDRNDAPELNAVFYDAEKMGELNYPNIVQFLFQINEKYRGTLPGDSQGDDKTTATMSDVLKIESLRFQVEGWDVLKEDFVKDEL